MHKRNPSAGAPGSAAACGRIGWQKFCPTSSFVSALIQMRQKIEKANENPSDMSFELNFMKGLPKNYGKGPKKWILII